MSVALYRNIVQHLTQEKLEELKHQKNALSQHFLPILQQAQDFSINTPNQILSHLSTGLARSPISNIFSTALMENVQHILQHVEDDPAISSSLIVDWIEVVTMEIQQALRKCQHSFLYASLLTEWLEHEERQQANADITTLLPSESKRTAISKVEAIMLTHPPTNFDSDAFSKFLSENIFKRKEADEVLILERMVQRNLLFFSVEHETCTRQDVVNCVNGLKASKSLAPDKLIVLNDIKENDGAQQEIADLLTHRLTNIETWQWPKNISKQVVDFRRGHTGEYKLVLNEDIITALLLQYIGVKWASHFKQELGTVYNSKLWNRTTSSFNSVEHIRDGFHRNLFLLELSLRTSGQQNSNDEYVKIETTPNPSQSTPQTSSIGLFGSKTEAPPQTSTTAFSFGASSNSTINFSSTSSSTSTFGAPKNNFGAPVSFGFPATASAQPSSGLFPPHLQFNNPNSYWFHSDNHTQPPPLFQTNRHTVQQFPHLPQIDLKQKFLHLLNVEMQLSQVVSPDLPLIVMQAEIEDFESSILHDSVLVVLESFGVSSKWNKFFTKFMKVEVLFPGKKNPTQIFRGLPASHTLSTLFGELLMFILEFLINQHCNGLRVFRFQSEVWFWSKHHDIMSKAWDILNGFGKMVGLKIRDTRSGSVSVLSVNQLSIRFPGNANLIIYGPSPLPQAAIHWGYLVLRSNGTFQIDQDSITKFVNDMKLLLDKASGVLEWINIFNKHMAFFVKNFGKPANVSGKQHVGQIVEAVKLIYSLLFGSFGGSPVDTLRHKFEILRENEVIDAILYWPLKLGGLGLINPLIQVLSFKQGLLDEDNTNCFKNLPDKDKQLWDLEKAKHDKLYGNMQTQATNSVTTIRFGINPVIEVEVNHPSSTIFPIFPIPIMETFDEFISKRETKFVHWYTAYLKMMEIPTPNTLRLSRRLIEVQSSFGFQSSIDNFAYLGGLCNFYESQLVKYFGSLNFVNSKLLPMSMIEKILDAEVKFD